MSIIINKSICSDLSQIKSFLENILKQINEDINDDTLLFDIKLILHELVANGAIHGNRNDVNKNIDLYLELDNDHIKIEVTDEGLGFYYDKNKYNPMELKCNGRGLVIVDGLSDEFYVNKNKAVCIKYL
ncbi:ATP-binding protein [Dethiothermospora halolimnae]|uniref:ATP-binding protein n=1 Tax=Dethiothermospora halolimnae TaxID=3114390 RepID=UPI003CCBF6DE